MNRTSLEKKWIKQKERNRQKEKTDRQICTPAHCIALSGYLELFKNSFPQIIFFRHKKKKNIQGKKKHPRKKKTEIASGPNWPDGGLWEFIRFKLVREFLPTRNNGGCFKHTP